MAEPIEPLSDGALTALRELGINRFARPTRVVRRLIARLDAAEAQLQNVIGELLCYENDYPKERTRAERYKALLLEIKAQYPGSFVLCDMIDKVLAK